jgi:hypothetical protein
MVHLLASQPPRENTFMLSGAGLRVAGILCMAFKLQDSDMESGGGRDHNPSAAAFF